MATRRQILAEIPESRWHQSGASMAMSQEEIFSGLEVEGMDDVLVVAQVYYIERAVQGLIIQHDSYDEVEEGVSIPTFSIDDPAIKPPPPEDTEDTEETEVPTPPVPPTDNGA